MGTTRAPDESSSARVIRVFLLDDHELVRRGLRDILASTGDFDVVGESGSAQEAGRRIPALRPDIALLDVRLPDGSGIEVCRQVRARDPRIRAVMVTTYDNEEARLSATLAGASGFVLKQIRGGDLVGSLRRVAAGENLVDPADLARRARSGSADPRLSALTPQERRILTLIAEGLTNRQIGERLRISEKTVKNHVTQILGKLGFSRRTQAAVFAVEKRHSAPRRPGPADGR